MKELFVQDLKAGDAIFGEAFVVKYYRKGAAKNNHPFIDLELADRTGVIKGKIWSQDMPNCDEVKEGEVVKINGTVKEFNKKLQIEITKLEIEKKFILDDFQMKSRFDIEEMFLEIKEIIKGIKNPHIRSLLETIFYDKVFAKEFKKASGAYTVHHNYIGGLLEHTAEVAHIAKSLSEKFPKINSDILLAGALLHDIGKVYEYEVGTTVTISKEGRLLGHIFLGAEYVKNKAPKDMPKDLLDEILHLVLSHHRELQFGSPVVPMTTEAIALAMCDKTSSDTNMAYNAIHYGNVTNEFTEYHKQLGTELYRSPYLDTLINNDIPF